MEALFIILNANCAKCGMSRTKEKEVNNGREEYNCIFTVIFFITRLIQTLQP